MPTDLVRALRRVAEWTVLVALGGALGFGTARAVGVGTVSDRVVLIGTGVLMAAAVAFAIWTVRSFGSTPWDDADDPDPPAAS